MLKKIIIPAIAIIAFSFNASALNAKGKFKKKSHKIKGAWALVEIEDKQVLAFHDNFKTKGGTELKIVLSKKSIRSLSKTPTFEDPLVLSVVRSNTGNQNYVVPAHINLEDYESIVLHSEADNVLFGGFDIPSKRRGGGFNNELGDAFQDDDRDSGSYGS